MKKDDNAFPMDITRSNPLYNGFTKFEYVCIEMMKASVIADNNLHPTNRSTERVYEHANDAVRLARALFNSLENEEGR